MATKQQQVHDAILHTLVENPNLPLKLIVKIVGCSKSTVIRTLKKYLTLDTINRKPGSGYNLNINKKLKTNFLSKVRANHKIFEGDLSDNIIKLLDKRFELSRKNIKSSSLSCIKPHIAMLKKI